MSYVIHKGDFAKTFKENKREILCFLRNKISEEIHQWKIGGLSSISAKEVLLSFLLKLEEISYSSYDTAYPSKKICEGLLRGMWIESEFTSPSFRSKYRKQFGRQFTDSLSALSQILALDAETAWINYCNKNASHIAWDDKWEEGISRTTDGVPFLVDRLRGLGNAVVPCQAKEAFKILMGL